MANRLSTTFKSLKPHNNSLPNRVCPLPRPSQVLPPTKSSSPELPPLSTSSSLTPWVVYLILSTNTPMKTYVGVTNNFCRRLKQHNGELKGGAKASRAGRPWVCACLIKGFSDKSQAYAFEAKWKSFSRKLSRKNNDKNQEQTENPHSLLLQHRYAALNQVKGLIDCGNLEINWKMDPL